MSDSGQTIAAIDRAVGDWEAWVQADKIAEYARTVLGLPVLQWQRRVMTERLAEFRRQQ